MLTLVTSIKLIAEIALLSLAGQFLLGLLTGAKRDQNLFYQVLGILTRPFVRVARFVSPRVVLDRPRRIDVAYLEGPWNADVYGMYQSDHGLLDRLPLGFEARYVSGVSSFLGLFEYDMHFGEISTVLANGTTTIGNGTVFNVSLDYRRAPLLRTSNALVGQPVSSLDQLLLTYTQEEIHHLALDRTAKSTSAFISVTQQIGERFSIGGDITIWNLSGMPASGSLTFSRARRAMA